ncbi:MAG: hypothetical protein AAFU77_03665 [Myxococcota bacterium]
MESEDNPWPRRLVRLLIVLALVGVAFLTHRRLMTVQLPELQAGDEHLPVVVYHLASAGSRASSHPLQSWAGAAAEHDVGFLVITDLNDQLAGPVEYHGVSVVSAAELATPFGRVVQLGADGVLAEDNRSRLDVLGSIRELGGTPLISHLGDPKTPWEGPVEETGGIEIASFTSSMRRTAGRIFLGGLSPLIAAQFRPRVAMAHLYDRDERALARWDEESDPSVIGICGADTSGLLPPELNLDSWRLVLDAPLDDETDAADGYQLVERIREGRFFCAAGVFSPRPYFRFGALAEDSWVARQGDEVPAAGVSQLVVFGPTGKPDTPTLVLLRNGEEIARVVGTELRYDRPRPGTYRVEARVPVPEPFWGVRMVTAIYSNRLRLTAKDLE